mgnify:CR=1 FL=1
MVTWNGSRPDFRTPCDKEQEAKADRARAAKEAKERIAERKSHGVTHEQMVHEGEVGRKGAKRAAEERKGWITRAIESQKKDEPCGCPDRGKKSRSMHHGA